ncbi:unnamed protein product, partial [Closterium sp. NIES-54]
FSRPSPLLASIPAALELVLASRATNSSSRLSGCPALWRQRWSREHLHSWMCVHRTTCSSCTWRSDQ